MLSYISLFSCGGVGCYGFKQQGFECVATNEIELKRLNIQKANKKCKYETGYINGDITLDETKNKIFKEIEYWKELLNPEAIFAVSALHDHNIPAVLQFIHDKLPEHPPYYDKDTLTDRTERFFVSEIIREKIFKLYDKEIPYSTEVLITAFKEEGKLTRISAEVVVERDSQKNIIIGKGGEMIKKVGTYARQDIEVFLSKKVFLEIFVKVIADWRNRKNYLKSFGYEN